MKEVSLKLNEQLESGPDSERNPFKEHLRLCVDWCADDLIYADHKVSSIEEGIEEGSHYREFGGDIFIYNSVTQEKVHWIQRASGART